MATINLPGQATVGGSAGGIATTLSGHGYQSSIFTSTLAATAVTIDQNGIAIDEHKDITIGGMSVKKTLESINDRLAILAPDPSRLEKFEALKQAYDHYKTLEALLYTNDK